MTLIRFGASARPDFYLCTLSQSARLHILQRVFGGPNAAARVHRSDRRRSRDVAAGCACAKAGDAAGWISLRQYLRRRRAPDSGFHQRTERGRLRRRQNGQDRVSVGRRPVRQTAVDGCRSCSRPGRRDRRDRARQQSERQTLRRRQSRLFLPRSPIPCRSGSSTA